MSADAPSSDPLLVERRADGVTVLTLNVPERRNAMTAELTAAWTAALDVLADDAALRAVVVAATPPAFCAGGDLAWILGPDPTGLGPEVYRTKMLPFYRAWLRIRDLPVPSVAAIEGPAVGAGLCLALACDLRYVGPRARFSAPFTTLGMHPGMGATRLIPEAVGLPRARELLYAGRVVDAETAVSWGLAAEVATDARARALEVATTIATAAPLATRLTKAALGHPQRSLDEAIAWEGAAQGITMATEDLAEGIAAARERRTPAFRHR